MVWPFSSLGGVSEYEPCSTVPTDPQALEARRKGRDALAFFGLELAPRSRMNVGNSSMTCSFECTIPELCLFGTELFDGLSLSVHAKRKGSEWSQAQSDPQQLKEALFDLLLKW